MHPWTGQNNYTSRNTPYSRTPHEPAIHTEARVDILQNYQVDGQLKMDFLHLRATRRLDPPGQPLGQATLPASTRTLCPHGWELSYSRKVLDEKSLYCTTQTGRLVLDKWTRTSWSKNACGQGRPVSESTINTWRQNLSEEYYHANDGLQAAYYDGANPTGPLTE